MDPLFWSSILYVNYMEILFSFKVMACHLIKILLNWINISFLESCDKY